MSEALIIAYLTDELENVHVVSADGNSFFYLGPMDLKTNAWPFMTLVANDAYDQFSDLNREGIFRVNVGVSKETFLSLFGERPAHTMTEGPAEGFDYTALDTLMPHPLYGSMYWVSVLNPSEKTEAKTKELIQEAYETMKRKQMTRPD